MRYMAQDLRPSLYKEPSDPEVSTLGLLISLSCGFSMALMSGDCDGHGTTFILLSLEVLLCRL